MYQKILLIQLRQLGDILLTTPCIRAIKEQSPDSRVYFLAHEMGRKILADNPYLTETITYHESMSFKEQLALMQRIRAEKFDLVIDFMNNPRSALLSFASGSPKRAIKKSSRSFLYTDTVLSQGVGRYIVEEKMDALSQLGFKRGSINLDFSWLPEDEEISTRFFAENPKLAHASLKIVLAPCHRRPLRKWPASSYSRLADHLIQELGAEITWLWGGKEEKAEVEAIAKECAMPTHLAPDTSFKELAALIAKHDLFIGNSNGPSHLAVVTNLKTLQLHGPTDGRSWSQIGRAHV